MITEWITPKTDWSSDDHINFYDINRIVNNLEFLKRFAYSLVTVPYQDMTYKKEDYTDIPFADEINAIEKNLESLNINTYNIPIGTTRTYEDNGYTINFVELNRIESAQLRLYDYISTGREPLQVMEFTLGAQGVFRV